MRIEHVTYTVKLTLGQYENEELSVTISQGVDGDSSGDEMITEARRICIQNSTHMKKKAMKKKQEQ